LYVASELWKHELKLVQQKGGIKEVKHPASCDVVLAKTGKKLEVKWGVFHYNPNDPFVKGSGGILFWGWGFSSGKQFKECILNRKNFMSKLFHQSLLSAKHV